MLSKLTTEVARACWPIAGGYLLCVACAWGVAAGCVGTTQSGFGSSQHFRRPGSHQP